MFLKIGIHKIFAILTRKYLCWSLFSIKLQAFRSATLLKRSSKKSVSLVNITKLLGAALFIEYLWWLFLHFELSQNLLRFVPQLRILSAVPRIVYSLFSCRTFNFNWSCFPWVPLKMAIFNELKSIFSICFRVNFFCYFWLNSQYLMPHNFGKKS